MKLIWEINLAREQLLVQLKMEADKNNSEREKMQAELNQKREQALLKTKAEADEATKKREQMFMEHELKRQKLLIDANSSIQLERVKQDSHGEIANLEALERRELEFQQLQQKEAEVARVGLPKIKSKSFS